MKAPIISNKELNSTLKIKELAVTCTAMALAKAKERAKIIKHQASSMATIPKRVSVKEKRQQ